MSELKSEFKQDNQEKEVVLSTLSTEKLQEECLSLHKENAYLNCRLLGVNELARLLQEKTELCETLQDKNKRLEIAVVRLENRCSNFEKKLKSPQFSSLPTTEGASGSPLSGKTHQSPFIPGPSKQILESLMKENTELKKTIDSLTKKGPTGYREAVKMNQLEEVIEQKNDRIELLRKQLETLTTSQKDGDVSDQSSEIGRLSRQLLKMEQAMKVKDRFCTLLSERMDQLQRELHEARKSSADHIDGIDSGIGSSHPSILHGQANQEFEIKERNMKKMIDELQQRVEKEREEKREAITEAEENRRKLMERQNEIDSLQSQLDKLNTYTDTLVQEKESLSKQIRTSPLQTTDHMTTSTKLTDLEQSLSQYKRDLESKNFQIDQLKRLLEDAQYKYALAESKSVNFNRIGELEDKVKELEDEKSSLENEIGENRRKIQDLHITNTKLKYNTYAGPSTPTFNLRTGGAGRINVPVIHQNDEVTADSSGSSKRNLHDHFKDTIGHRQEVPPINYTSRGIGTDGNTEATTSVVTTPTSYTMSSEKPMNLPIQSQTGMGNPSPGRPTYRSSVTTPSGAGYLMSQAVYPTQQGTGIQYPIGQDALTYQTYPSNQIPGQQRQNNIPTSQSYLTHQASHQPVGVVPIIRSMSNSPGPYTTSPYSVHSTLPHVNPSHSAPPSAHPVGSSVFGGTYNPSQYSGQRFDGMYYSGSQHQPFYYTPGYMSSSYMSGSQPTNTQGGQQQQQQQQPQQPQSSIQRRNTPPHYDPRYSQGQ